MAKIFISKNIKSEGIELLSSHGHEVKVWNKEEQITKEQLIEECLEVDALVSMLSDNIDSDFLSKCKNLKVISNYAVGYNNIDVTTANSYNIAIGNTPDVLTNATADLAFALLLNLSRKIKAANKNVIDGDWKGWEPKGFMGTDLRGKTVGIFGAGRIGQEFAKLCSKAFDMNVLYCSRTEKINIENELNAKKVTFETLLKDSDVISLHCDLNEATKDIIKKSSLSLCEKRPIFINTARGEMHDEDDLLWALKKEYLSGIGLDVTNPEPMDSNHPLLKEDNCIITPHIGSATHLARKQMSLMVANNIINALNQKPLQGDVNKIYS
jgi:glyoxylate reductase